jgi:uncharacterized protein involved in outer membrane biogenesis
MSIPLKPQIGNRPIVIGAGMIVASVLVAGLFGNDDPRLVISQSLRAATSEIFKLSTPIVLSESPRLILEQGTLSMRARPAGRWQRSGSALSTLLSGEADLELKDAVFAFEPVGQDNVDVIAATALDSPLLKAFHSSAYQSITIERATILKLRPGASPDLIGTVSAVLTPASKSIDVKGTFERKGELLEANATISNPSFRRKDAPLALTGSISGRHCDIRIHGRLMRGKDAFITSDKSTIHIRDMKALTRWLGTDGYSGPGPNVFYAEGRSEWTENTVSLENSNFVIDGNRAEGSLAASFAGARPAVEGTLAFSSFDIDPYLDATTSSTSRLPSVFAYLSEPISVWPAATVNPIARVFDADIRVSFNNVTRKGEGLGKGAATVSIKNGRAHLGITGVELNAGGEGEGQILADLTRSPPFYSVRGELRDFDFATLAGSSLPVAPIAGTGTLRIDFSAAGQSETDLMSSLNGSAEASMLEGARLGLDLPGLFNSARNGPVKGWGNHLAKIFPVDAVTVRISAANGILTTNSVEAHANNVRFVAAGTLNISRQIMDLEISRVLTGQHDGSSADAHGNFSVRLKGPLADPDVGSVSLVHRS